MEERMTAQQLFAMQRIGHHRHRLSKQQVKTLNGCVKAGDAAGALRGLDKILARQNKK